MKCVEHRYVLYDRTWHICQDCDHYYQEQRMTNHLKAHIIALVNAVLILAVAFGVPLTDAQYAAIGIVSNAALSVWVAVTYKNSPAYVPPA